MISRKRAALEANALLKAARERREREASRKNRWMLQLFPLLSQFEPSKRQSVLIEARQRAMSRRHVRIAQFLVLMPAAAWVFALIAQCPYSRWLLGLGLVVVLAAQIMWHWQTRSELRAMAIPRSLSRPYAIEGPVNPGPATLESRD